MHGDVHGEGGLAHAGAPANDDEVGRLEAGGHLVEVLEARLDAGDLRTPDAGLLHAFEALDQRLVYAREPAPAHVLAEVEDGALGAVVHLVGVLGDVVAEAGDVVAHVYQVAPESHLFDDLGVMADVVRVGGRIDQGVDIGPLAHLLEEASPLELFGEDHGVCRTAGRVELDEHLEYLAVGFFVEILADEHLLGVGNGGVGKYHRPQDGLFGLEVVGRDPVETAAVRQLHRHDVPFPVDRYLPCV